MTEDAAVLWLDHADWQARRLDAHAQQGEGE